MALAAKDITVMAAGKRALMGAALRLALLRRSLSLLGIRELAREAGLNPNTFYRHFKCMDELGLAIIIEVVEPLRRQLRDLRAEAAKSAALAEAEYASQGVDLARAIPVTTQTVRLFFDVVAAHPQAFMVGIRELHGPSAVLRQALRQVMEDFASDMCEDIERLGLLPGLETETVMQLSRLIVHQMFHSSLDYLEAGADRDGCCSQANLHIISLFLGAAALKRKGIEALQLHA